LLRYLNTDNAVVIGILQAEIVKSNSAILRNLKVWKLQVKTRDAARNFDWDGPGTD